MCGKYRGSLAVGAARSSCLLRKITISPALYGEGCHMCWLLNSLFCEFLLCFCYVLGLVLGTGFSVEQKIEPLLFWNIHLNSEGRY